MRRHGIPDNRPDWRDPEMPVLNKHGELVAAKLRQDHAKVALSKMGMYDWRHDPTYDLRRKRERARK